MRAIPTTFLLLALTACGDDAKIPCPVGAEARNGVCDPVTDDNIDGIAELDGGSENTPTWPIRDASYVPPSRDAAPPDFSVGTSSDSGTKASTATNDASAADSADAQVKAPDTGTARPCYVDLDGDGEGSGEPVPCALDAVYNRRDCDDDNAKRATNLAELCDQVDNDCDGQTDEDNVCAPKCIPHAESCNLLDDDCDGIVDNGLANLCGGCKPLDHAPGAACVVGQGVCQVSGVYACDGIDALRCKLADGAVMPAPSPEACDQVDNDCDGQTDEDGVCIPKCIPRPETCDNSDEDCDGVIDNGVKNACGGSCAFPISNAPNSTCIVGVGACQREGWWFCSPDLLSTYCTALPGTPEDVTGVCRKADGIDNDCDGKVDEPEQAHDVFGGGFLSTGQCKG
ncbi:MAG TPA: putative metal-binding motif-containing protein [Polyangiales bacterium]|nr:putative metal-binding motif-containing protein [Polyangiales bacterium]